MSAEELERSIIEADNNSLRIGAANRILQLLQKLRYSNSENSAKRWIWELCQNAKDTCNSTNKVKIAVDFDETNKKVIFKHNGKAFSMKNAMSLINQSSCKDGNNGSDGESGKFGTGFLTTHLLSEVVNVSGILQTGEGSYSSFHFTLDRTGHEKEEIVKSMKVATQQLKECIPLKAEPDWNVYNTIFEYELEESGIEVAKQGIKNLKVSAPFVLSMLENIEEIILVSTGETFRNKGKKLLPQQNMAIHEIIHESGDTRRTISILNLSEEEITISVELNCINSTISFVPFADIQPKLFCDFPLIGTEDFPFPVVISSKEFNPTEPRDGIFLTCKSKSKIDNEIAQNRKIVERACELYSYLLQYAARNNWGGIYHITHIDTYMNKEWYDEEWNKEIVDKCKDIILKTNIIRTSKNELVSLQDNEGNKQIYIISDEDQDVREKIWELLYEIMPDSVPCRKDVHNWYKSLWKECNRYTLRSLTDQLQKYGTIDQLQEKIVDGNWQEWISKYYDVIGDNKRIHEYILTNRINIIPDQKGKFHGISELFFDCGILEEYKDILDMLETGTSCRSYLININLSEREWFNAKAVDNIGQLKCIEDRLENADEEIKGIILFRMMRFYNENEKNLQTHKKIYMYVERILKISDFMEVVSFISEKILQEALVYSLSKIAERISSYGCVDQFAQYLEITIEDAEEYIKGFIEFVVQEGFENLINDSRKPILPNQNRKFKTKDDLFMDNGMDETLKNISVSAGYDIKEELLMKSIYLALPENRGKKNQDLSSVITQYVNCNRQSNDEKIRSTFRKLLLWITDNEEKAKEVFPDLYKHKHYLYDDEEITSNIRKAEEFQDIMKKFSISNVESLEEIIRRGQVANPIANEKSEITQEVLIRYGIDSAEALERAFLDKDFSARYHRPIKHNPETFEYVKAILKRSQENILSYLKARDEYDLSDKHQVSDTIFVIKKDQKEIYLLARPSDGKEVRIYYKEELDLLDYSMDWELWVEDGKTEPQKLTFGKIIRLTRLNRIPLGEE